MKRNPRQYYPGDRIIDRAWKRKGTVTSVPKNFSPLSRVGVDWDDGTSGEAWVPGIMLDPDYVEKLVKQLDPKYYVPKVGDRVKIPSIGIKGTVEFVDINTLYFLHMYAIQVLLDEPYDDTGQRMYRTNLKDIKKLGKKKKDKEKKKVKKDKPKKTKAPAVLPDDDILWDDEELEWD